MAVIDLEGLEGIRVTILQNGKPMKEFPDDDDVIVEHPDPDVRAHQIERTVSTYLQAEEGERYSILLTVDPPYEIDVSKLEFVVSVDGKFAWKAHCPRPDYLRKKHWECPIDGLKEGKGRSCTNKGFEFARVDLNEEWYELSRMKRLKKRYGKLGSIEVRVFRTGYGKEGGDTEAKPDGFISRDGIELPEETVKAGRKTTLGTCLTRPEKTQRGPFWREAKKKDGEHYPIVIFRFMYCSEEALKIKFNPEDDSKPSPSRSPSPERDEDGLTLAQRQELEAEEARIEEELRRQKEAALAKIQAENERKRKDRDMSSTEVVERAKIKQENLEAEREETERRRRQQVIETARGIKRRKIVLDLTGDDVTEIEADADGGEDGNGEQPVVSLFVG